MKPDAHLLAAAATSDGEFMLAARHWSGAVCLRGESWKLALVLEGGKISGAGADAAQPTITLTASDEIWSRLLAAKPPRFYNDVALVIAMGEMTLEADPVHFAQYYPALMRLVELLRPAAAVPAKREEARPSGMFDAPIGRYIHLSIEGQDHRIYFEEAGQGIPLLLQHTAGCHGSQWRHLFECREITDHFRLIAYDLPFHGKSLPPVGPSWWSETYALTGAFLRAVPVGLAQALGLDRPVFMGCSVGGLLALDLALHHPQVFSAVISLEGALKVEGDPASLEAMWHPQVSNEYKARLMNALMCPTSPEAYRKETSYVYASGWPPAFRGDLHYYTADCDLRELAQQIDTSRTAVHILSGEYDASGTAELGQEAHAAIAGSSWAMMPDMGHFPMSENPEAFLKHLLPVLDQIKAAKA